MAGESIIIPATHRVSGAGMIFAEMPSFSDTVFGFLDENYPLSENSSDYSLDGEWVDDDEEEEEENIASFEEKKTFWDEQEKLLHGILCRTTAIESRVRNATKEALRQFEGTIYCGCPNVVATEGCRDCLRKGIFDHLCSAGFKCLIQTSKWKSCREIPSGEHTYLEVVENSSPNKEVRVVIELNFRVEFEMGRASQEYNNLIRRLPEVYVGKRERLRNLIKILCGAAKKCMKDKKMHLAPWRKHKYMQAKWLNTCTEFTLNTATSKAHMVAGYSNRPVKPRASMLTLGLLEKLTGSHCQSIAVL